VLKQQGVHHLCAYSQTSLASYQSLGLTRHFFLELFGYLPNPWVVNDFYDLVVVDVREAGCVKDFEGVVEDYLLYLFEILRVLTVWDPFKSQIVVHHGV